MIDVPGVEFRRHVERGPGEQPAVLGCACAALRGPAGQEWQACGQDGGLQFVEAAVHPHLAVVIAVGLPAIPDPLHLRRQRGIAGGDGAAVSERAEVLGRIEAVGRRHAERSDARPAARRKMGLAAVLDNGEAVPLRDGRDGRHVGRLAVQVHREDGGGAGRDGGLDRGGIDRQPPRIDVGEHRPRAGHHAGQRRVGRGEGRRDDLVARADPQGAKDDRDGIRPRADAHAERRAAAVGERPLERLDLGPQHVPAALDHPADRGLDGGTILARREAHARDAGRAHGDDSSHGPGSR